MEGERKLKAVVMVISVALILGGCARDPQKAKAKYLAQGQKYMKKGQYGDASVEFRNALRLDPRWFGDDVRPHKATCRKYHWFPFLV